MARAQRNASKSPSSAFDGVADGGAVESPPLSATPLVYSALDDDESMPPRCGGTPLIGEPLPAPVPPRCGIVLVEAVFRRDFFAFLSILA